MGGSTLRDADNRFRSDQLNQSLRCSVLQVQLELATSVITVQMAAGINTVFAAI